jgi:phage gp16-like protein
MKHPDSDPTRKGDLAAIHVAKKALGWDDATYRDLLQEVCGVRSSAGLDFAGRRRWLAHLRKCEAQATTGKSAAARAKRKPLTGMQAKIWSLWMQLADKDLVQARTMAAIDAWVARQTGVDRMQWLTPAQLGLAVESLKRWLARGAE